MCNRASDGVESSCICHRCTALWEIKDNDEKDSAFRGFCMLIQANPAGIQKDYLWFCNAVCKWQRPSPELNDMFHKVGPYQERVRDIHLTHTLRIF
jgi:hypothetical protein